MKSLSKCVLCAIALLSSTGCQGQVRSSAGARPALQISEADGGSIVTKLGYGIEVNKGSSLHRRWFVLNDPTAPVQLASAGISTVYKSSSIGGDYEYVPVGSINAAQPISAYEIRYLLFDVWGEHMRTLSATNIVDMTGTRSTDKDGMWRAWENDVSQMQTVVAFVARVRTADGRVWQYDPGALLRSIDQVKVKLTEQELNPEKEKQKP